LLPIAFQEYFSLDLLYHRFFYFRNSATHPKVTFFYARLQNRVHIPANMPPQAANSSTDTVTISGAKLEVIRATLCRMDFKGIFIAVGEDLGLAQPKTA
jgi:hypothetical protein